MRRICIIGGGFAGISALRYFAKHGDDSEVILIDKKETSDFLPLIPDVVGGVIDPRHAQVSLSKMVKRFKGRFINDEVTSINFQEKKICTGTSSVQYDYLLIACGSQTNFYGNENIRNHALKLDSVDDANRIKTAIALKQYRTILVSGGGYTGIELITNAWLLCRRHGIKAHFVLVERAPSLVQQLPRWMQEYVSRNLESLRIDVRCNSSVECITNDSLKLSDGTEYTNVLFLWSAGVTIPEITLSPEIERRRQARISVDGYLRVNEFCFAAGDAAGYLHAGETLRMGVQFSLMEGQCAAQNIILSINGMQLKPFHPVELGYIVPMANRKACGNVLGLKVKGSFAMLMHYLMCVFRTYQHRDKWSIIKDVLKNN